MFAVRHNHIKCLQRLLLAAGVPSNIPDEAVYAIVLHLSSLNEAGTGARRFSVHTGVPKSARAAAQLQSLHAVHSATATLQEEGADNKSSLAPEHNAPSQQQQDAVVAPVCFDLAAAVAAEREKQRPQQSPVQQDSSKPQQGSSKSQRAKRVSSTAAHASQPMPAGHGRLGGLKQLLGQDVKAQQLTHKLKTLKQKQQQRQQDWRESSTPAQQVLQQQQQQQQQQPMQTAFTAFDGAAAAAAAAAADPQQDAMLQQHDKARLREQLSAFVKADGTQHASVAQQQQQQQPVSNAPKEQLPHKIRRSQQRQGQHVSSQQKHIEQQQQHQQQQQQQQQHTPSFRTRSVHRSTALPFLLQHMLLHEEAPGQHPERHSAAAVGTTSTSSSSSSHLSAAHCSNWVDIDTSQVYGDMYNTFLGVWPDPGSLPRLLEYEEEEPYLEDQQKWQVAAGAADASVEAAAAGVSAGDGLDADADIDASPAAAGAVPVMQVSRQQGDDQQLLQAPAEDGTLTVLLGGLDAGAGSAEGWEDAGTEPVSWVAPAGDDDFDDAAAADVAGSLDAAWPVTALDAAVGDAAEAAFEGPDPASLQQQQLEAAASNAGWVDVLELAGQDTAVAATRLSSSSSTAAAGQRWSVDNMFDAADLSATTAADEAFEYLLLYPFSGLPAADTQQLLQHGHEYCPDSATAAAAAVAALRASDAAAAAAAQLLPQVRWPPHASLLCAMQAAQLELERGLAQGQVALVCPPTDRTTSTSSSSSSSSDASSSCSAAATAIGDTQHAEQPFAWMFNSPHAVATAAAAGRNVDHGSGLQHILSGLHAMLPEGAQQFVLQAPPEAAVLHPPVDASLLQYLPPQQVRQQGTSAAGWLYAAGAAGRHNTDSAPQHHAGASHQQTQLSWKELWEAAKDFYSWSGSSAASPSTGATQHFDVASSAGWKWDSSNQHHPQQQQQQVQPQRMAAGDAVADGQSSPAFELQPAGHHSHTLQEQVVLSRVVSMSAGTCLEPLLWSVLTQQPTQFLPGRSGLLQPGVRRQMLVPPGATTQKQHVQPMPAAAAAVEQQRHLLKGATDWFGAVLVLTGAAVQRTGQLVCSRFQQQQPPEFQLPDCVAHSSSGQQGPSAHASAGHASSALSLAATLPTKAGWDPVRSCWEDLWLQPEPHMPPGLKRTLSEYRRLHRKLGQQGVSAAAAAPTGRFTQPGAVLEQIVDEIGLCKDAASLWEVVRDYGHYFGRFPSLPAAVLQQALQVLGAAGPSNGNAAVNTAAAAAAEGSLSSRPSDSMGGPTSSRPAAAADFNDAGGSFLSRLSDLLSGPTPSSPPAAAAASGQDSMRGSHAPAAAPAAGVLQQKGPQLEAMANSASGNPAGAVFQTLVRWFTDGSPQPYDLLSITKQHVSSVSSSSSSEGSAAQAQLKAQVLPNKADCLCQLLSLGIIYRGTLLPTSTSLHALLRQLQPTGVLQVLQEQHLSQLSQQLLSPAAALQSWPLEEQHVAFALLRSAVQLLQPPGLLRLLQLLTQQVHLRELPKAMQQEPATVYRAAMEQLSSQAQFPQMAAQFAQAAPELLQVARQACLASGYLSLEAADGGSVVPGEWYFKAYGKRSNYKQHIDSDYPRWNHWQHADYISTLRQWPSEAAALPTMSAEVMRAAAMGQLQQVAGILQNVLLTPGAQELDPVHVADLLKLLACSQPFLSYAKEQDAVIVAAVVRGNSNGLLKGAKAMGGLPAAVSGWLADATHVTAPVQQLPPDAAVTSVWAALQLKLQPSHVQTILDLLCTPQQIRAGGSGSSSSSTGGQGHLGPQRVQPLTGWALQHLQLLLETCHAASKKDDKKDDPQSDSLKFKLQQDTLAVVGSAAAQHVREYSAAVTACAERRQGGLTALLQFDGNHTAGASVSDGLAREILRARASRISSIAYIMYCRRHYHPALLQALQGLVVASNLLRHSKKTRANRWLILDRYALRRVLLTLARFDSCSSDAASAIRELVTAILPHFGEAALADIAWSLAALDERDLSVWTALRHVFAGREGHTAAGSVATFEGAADPSDKDAAAALGLEAEEDARPTEASNKRNLHLAHVFVQLFVPDAAPLLPSKLAKSAAKTVKKIEQKVAVSKLQREVGHILGRLQASENSVLLSYQQEEKTGFGSIDIVVRVRSKWGPRPVAIEVDGPFHFAINSPGKALGTTVLRDRLYAGAGFKMLVLPYNKLQEMEKEGHRAAAWMEQMLGEIAAAPPTPTQSIRPGIQPQPIQLADALKKVTAA